MTVEDVLREHRIRIVNALPPDVDVSGVEYEGALLVVYTKHPEKFADRADDVRRLAKQLQKRIIVRPDATALTPIDAATKKIKEILPEECELTNVYWEPDIGEVTIEVARPGMAIGPGGSLLNDIKRAIGWAPKIVRTPPVQSRTVHEVRGYIRQASEERKRILRAVGRRLHRGVSTNLRPWLRLMTLGGYREVGRNCSLLQTQDSRVFIDCGMSLNLDDPDPPNLDLNEVKQLGHTDGVIVTGADLHRSGLVPLLYERGYDGPVYCTAPTRDLMTLLQMDYVKSAPSVGLKPLYGAEAVRETLKHTITLNYGDTTDISPDLRLTLYNSGHLLGSSVAHFHVGDGLYNIGFTGDIRYERSSLLHSAHNRFPRCETIVMEATHGGARDFAPARRQSLQALQDVVSRTAARGGKVLMPVFPGGAAQELMLALDQILGKNDVPDLPVYLDGHVWEATAIHTAYPEFLNNQVRSRLFQQGENPILSERFQRVDAEDKRTKLVKARKSSVVLANNGYLTWGPAVEYLKAWAGQDKHAVALVHEPAPGTPARWLLEGQRELQDRWTNGKAKEAETIQVTADIAFVDGFTGHSDRRQLLNYVGNMDPRPERVILQQGEPNRCMELAAGLHRKFGIESRPLMNLETIRFR